MTIYIDVDADGVVCVYDGDVENGYEIYEEAYNEIQGANGFVVCATYRLDDLIALGEEVKKRNALGENYHD